MPLAPLAAAFIIGLSLSSFIRADPRWLYGAIGLLLLVCVALLWRTHPTATTSLLLGSFIVLGVLWGQGGGSVPPHHLTRIPLAPFVTLEAQIAREPERWSHDRTRLLLAAQRWLDGEAVRPGA